LIKRSVHKKGMMSVVANNITCSREGGDDEASRK